MPLWEAIHPDIKSIGACFRAAMKSIYNIPNICIAATPNVDMSTIRKKSVFIFKRVPVKNTAGINAKI